MTPKMRELADLQHVLLDVERFVGTALSRVERKDMDNALSALREAVAAIDKAKGDVQRKIGSELKMF